MTENNPFLNDKAPAPWEEGYPDVTSINAEASKRLHQLIDEKNKAPTKDIGVIFSGDEGVGKSHILWRLCNEAKTSNSEIFFASISPHIDTEKTMRYIVTEIARNFENEVDDFPGCTQFHRLVALIMQDFLNNHELKPEDVFNDKFSEDLMKTNKEVSSWLFKENSKISKKAIQFLFQCCGGEESKKLAFENLENESESSAHKYLLSFGILISRFNRSLLLCFDQFESIKSNEIRGFEQIILTILGFSQGIIPFVLVRSTEWNEMSTRKIDGAVVQRFGNKILSTPCSDADAKELIKSRYGEKWVDKIKLPLNPTPGQVIAIASEIVDPESEKIDMNAIAEKVKILLEKRHKKEGKQYKTFDSCIKELKLEKSSAKLKDRWPKAGLKDIVIVDGKQFAKLPLENIITEYLQDKPGKTLQQYTNWLPIPKDEICDIISTLYYNAYKEGNDKEGFALDYSYSSVGSRLRGSSTNSQKVTKSKEMEKRVQELKNEIHANPKEPMAKSITKIPEKELEEHTEVIQYCIQTHAIPLSIFLNGKDKGDKDIIDFKFFFADEQTLKAGYDAINTENIEYVMIHDLRKHLNWPRDVFDDLLDELEKKEVITLRGGAPGLLSEEEQQYIYVRHNTQKMLLYWRQWV